MEEKHVFGVEDAIEEVLSSIHGKNDFTLIPPNKDDITDDEVDSASDDEIDPATLAKEIYGIIELSSDEEEEAEPSSSASTSKNQPSSKYSKLPKYDELPVWQKSLPNPIYTKKHTETDAVNERRKQLIESVKNLSPRMLFEKFFDEKVQDLIIENSISYARKKNRQEFQLPKEDFHRFLGIVLLTGYRFAYNERDYWSTDPFYQIPIMLDTMSRDRFREIKQNVSFGDEVPAEKTASKMFQIKPLLEAIQANCLQFGVFHEKISIGEFMIRYFERHPEKQFVVRKTVKFGYRNFAATGSDGYCYAFDVYNGKTQETAKDPFGGRFVKSLLEKLNCNPQEHVIYVDDSFTTYILLKDLREMGYRASGCIKAKRTKKYPLLPVKTLRKKPPSTYDYCFDTKNEILFVRWRGCKVVTVGTNFDEIEPLGKVKNWCSVREVRANVNIPKLFLNYKEGFAGVYKMNKYVSSTRISLNGRKWWWIIFTYLIDMAVSNAWRLHCICASSENKKHMELSDFRRSIFHYYLCGKDNESDSEEEVEEEEEDCEGSSYDGFSGSEISSDLDGFLE